MKVEKELKQVTINKYIERLRKIIKLALAEGFLERDPFLLFKPKLVITQVVYLDTEELKIFENHQCKQERLQQVADMFIFCCSLCVGGVRSYYQQNLYSLSFLWAIKILFA